MKILKQFSVLFFIAFFVIGCAESRSGKVYSRDEARKSLAVQYGMVLEIHAATIEGTKTAAGPLMGGAAGAAVGSTVGSGSGKTVAAVLGGIAGSLGGAAIEEGVTRKNAFEITVRLDNGKTLIVVQEADVIFHVGDRIRVIKGPDGTTRVRQ